MKPELAANGALSRRHLLSLGLAGCAALALAACGQSAPAAPSPAASAPASVAAKPSGSPSTQASAKPAGSQAAQPASAQASSSASRSLDVVKQGNLRGLTLGAAIARERGYFAEQGVQSDETMFDSGSQQTPLIATGQLDIGTSSPTSAHFNALSRGVKQKFAVDNAHLEKGVVSEAIILRPDLVGKDIKTIADLKGRTLLAQTDNKQGGLGFAVSKVLASAGLKIEDVDWKIVPFPDMTNALANKQADGAAQLEPFITAAVSRGIAQAWQNLADFYPGEQAGALVFSEGFIRDRRDVARRWMVAHLRGVRDMNDFLKSGKDAQVVGPILTKATGSSADLVTKIQWLPIDGNGSLNSASIEADQKQLADWGSIKETFPIDQLVDTQFVDYAVQQLGKV